MTIPADFEQLTASPFSERIGPLYLSRRDDLPVVGLKVEAHHLNRAGRVHGGLLATVADIAVSRAAWDHVPEGATIATADLHIAYLGNVNAGAWVEAWPSVDRVGRRWYTPAAWWSPKASRSPRCWRRSRCGCHR